MLRPRRSRSFRSVDRDRRKTADSPKRSWSVWSVGYAFLWTAFFSLVVFALFFSPFLRIDRENIILGDRIPRDDISAVVEGSLSGKSFGILSNDTLIVAFLRRHDLEKKLLESFPMLRTATVSFVFPSTMVVRGEERTVSLVLCAGGPCFLVDERGMAFDSTSDVGNGDSYDFPTVIVDVSAKPVSSEDSVFSEDFLREFPPLRRELHDELGLDTTRIAETPSRFSDELWLRSVDGWDIRFSSSVPTEKSITALRLFLAKTISEGDKKNLEYIDLRTENRIFYLLKGDESNEEGNASPKPDEPTAKHSLSENE